MKVLLLNSKIGITNDLSKLLSDLESAKIKFNKIDGYVIFNAKILEELPEFLINVKYYNNEIYSVTLEYNYDLIEKDNYLKHKKKLNEYIFKTFGTPSKTDAVDNRETNSGVDKKERIIYNFNGPDYKKNTYKEADIYLQLVFKRKEDEIMSTKQIKMISLFGGAFIVLAGIAYYLIAKTFDFGKVLMCLGIGLAIAVALYFVGRFFSHGDIYSPREEKAAEKYFEKFENENEVFERFDCHYLYVNIFFEKMAYCKMYFAKDRVIILYMPYVKMHRIEIPYSDTLRLKSNKSTVIYRNKNNKKRYFLMPNELVANELIRTYKKYKTK